jgi:acylphosphatase
MADPAAKAVQLRIEGRVQGVSYRFWMVTEAERLGLTGWVRNRRDGSVEAVVHGPADTVDALVALAHRGPPAARVGRVVVEAASEAPSAGFVQRQTV